LLDNAFVLIEGTHKSKRRNAIGHPPARAATYQGNVNPANSRILFWIHCDRPVMSIAERFATLIARLAPTGAELAAYSTHLRTVTSAIEAALEINRTERVGSFSRGTALRGISDVDLMVVLTSNERKWGGAQKKSTTVLSAVRSALAARFVSTAVRNDRNAVVLSFAGGMRAVDVVPAFYVGPYLGPIKQYVNYPRFAIPDGEGDWLETSPQAHKAALSAEDERSRGKLTRVSLLAKHWAACHSHLTLQSFYLEILIACSGVCAGPRSYSDAMRDLLADLASRAGQGIRDPLKISGVIPATLTQAGRERISAAARHSAFHAARACAEEEARNTPEAIRQWRIVFNGQFPS
jgi:hypothetical protein